MKKAISFLIISMLMFSCAVFNNGSYPTPINDSLGNIIRSKADSTKSQKQLIVDQFGEPGHKFIVSTPI